MAESRRKFLKLAGASVLGAGAASSVTPSANASGNHGHGHDHGDPKTDWVMAIDMKRCDGCGGCKKACHEVHNVPDIKEPRHEIKWIWTEAYHSVFSGQVSPFADDAVKNRPTVVLCNHCDNPPCVRVCPTGATFKRPTDGIVTMDMHRCIGCRYCMAGCPYGARSFNFVDPRAHLATSRGDYPTRRKGVVEKCNFCSERLKDGPACVEACRKSGKNAILFGNPHDPKTADDRMVLEALRSRHAIRRRPELGTGPNVYYLV